MAKSVLKHLKDCTPFTFNILGHNFKVTFSDTITELGYMRSSSTSIVVNSTQAESQRLSTLIHEAIEAINALTELGLNHSQICTLETTLHQIYQANKL